jgi:Do/DeqQ family serine protease
MRAVTFALILALALPGTGHAETRVPGSPAEIGLSFAPVVRVAAPAVVNIYARRVVADRANPFLDDPFFGPLFRDFGLSQPRLQNSLGSGVILSPEGLVVSNHHVVGGAQEIRVVLADRREFEAEVVLSDEETDLAVLRLIDAPRDLPVLPLRDSDGVEVGELVLAIGNPFGIGQTVTSGIVSGLARSGAATGNARGWFIQTDAAINPGNSGGALVDVAGRLIGINTAILTRSGGSHGIGFAIPANLVARFLALAEAGADRFGRPWAGIAGQPVAPDVAEALGLALPDGFLLTELHPASPFAAAGLEPGDVILSIGGQAVNAPQDVIFRLSVAGTGAEVPATVWRDGRERTVTLRLDPPPDVPDPEPLSVPEGYVLSGLRVERINPRVIADLGLPLSAEGVAVTAAEGRAARAGLRRGDILLAVNGRPIARPRDLARALSEATRRWSIELLREGRRIELRFRL